MYSSEATQSNPDLAEMDLGLLKRTLTRFELEGYSSPEPVEMRLRDGSWGWVRLVNRLLLRKGLGIGRTADPKHPGRVMGEDWPVNAETMIGVQRINQLHEALDVVKTGAIAGDLMETGVGGLHLYSCFPQGPQFES